MPDECRPRAGRVRLAEASTDTFPGRSTWNSQISFGASCSGERPKWQPGLQHTRRSGRAGIQPGERAELLESGHHKRNRSA